jgi:hypothetical protein
VPPAPRAALHAGLALVQTATVDVHVLRLGQKQMTLAVFRQLPARKTCCRWCGRG